MKKAVEGATEARQYLTFQLAGQEYAIGVLRVREIVEYGTLTQVPQTPASIRGVINLRGNVVPVVDLAVRFELAPGPVTPRTCVIIVEVDWNDESVAMGIIADSVSKVVELSADEILPPPAFGAAVHVDCLTGMGKAGERFILLLDIDRVLGSAAGASASASRVA